MRHKPRPGPRATRWGSHPPAVLLLLLLLLAGSVGGALPANADDERRPLVPRRLFDQSRPGVELIMAEFKAKLTLPQPTITAANQRALQALVIEKVRRGEIPPSGTAARDVVINELARNPFRWYTRSDRVERVDLKVLAMGSGFSVSADGYIVTNAHVAAPRAEDLKATFLREGLSDEGDEVIQGLVAGGLPQRLATRLLEARLRWATKMGKLSHFKRRLEAATSSGTGGVFYSGNGRPAKLVSAGKEIPGKDVAILKVDAKDMATVQLGDDSALSTGDRLFVLGFPGPATFNPVLSKESQKEPTLTQGVLSAKKTASEGFPVLQTDAAMTHGNSGGPVFDEQGTVVGVATFGSVDPRTGREVAGMNFAVPVSVVNELLSQAKVKPVEGTATGKFRMALDAFEKKWYKRALPLFKDVKALDPSHPSVEKFIKDSETAIGQGRDQTPREVLGLPLVVFAAAVAVVALLLIGVVTALLRRRRRARRRRGEVPSAPAFEVQQGPIAAMHAGSPRQALGAQAVGRGDWWSDQPFAPVGPVGPVAGGYGMNGDGAPAPAGEQAATAPAWWPPAPGPEPEDQTVELPVQPVQPVAHPGPHRAVTRHDRWQREWRTAADAGPAQGAGAAPGEAWGREAPGQARQARPERPRPERPRVVPARAPLICWNCGYASPPTGRFCEQCWAVLES